MVNEQVSKHGALMSTERLIKENGGGGGGGG